MALLYELLLPILTIIEEFLQTLINHHSIVIYSVINCSCFVFPHQVYFFYFCFFSLSICYSRLWGVVYINYTLCLFITLWYFKDLEKGAFNVSKNFWSVLDFIWVENWIKWNNFRSYFSTFKLYLLGLLVYFVSFTFTGLLPLFLSLFNGLLLSTLGCCFVGFDLYLFLFVLCFYFSYSFLFLCHCFGVRT